ncbi:MAG: HAD family hydrolase [Gammaproteobacteria bacterium]|nr:HAD family hydrolase [Gammaproteobacteria bacterium]
MSTSDTTVSNDTRPLLILDIDQTLLFASTTPLAKPYDYQAERTWIYKRPHVDAFLHFCMVHFQIGVWTSARASYAEEIFSQVFAYFPLAFIHSEQHCLVGRDANGQSISIKPLAQLNQRGFELSRILMIDDSKEKHCLNAANLILVKPYYALDEDNELFLLEQYLNTIKQQANFLSLNNQHWRQASRRRME